MRADGAGLSTLIHCLFTHSKKNWQHSLVSSSTTKASKAGPSKAHNCSINAMTNRVRLHVSLGSHWDVTASQECLVHTVSALSIQCL